MSGLDPDQFPRPGQVFLDHTAIFVEEFERSGAVMARLGFQLTPLRLHTSALRPGEPMTALGTGNRCAMLRTGFIELLGPTSDTPMAAQLRGQLARYPGLHLIAFTATDPQRHHQALQHDGLDPLPIARLQRMQSMPSGEQEIRASIIRLAPQTWPEGRVQIVFPEMPADAMWDPALIEHPNAAERLSELLVVAQDPPARAALFGRFVQRPVQAQAGRCTLELDRGRVHFVDVATAQRMLPGLSVPSLPYVAAMAIRSRDLNATRAWLDRQGLACQPLGSALWVPGAQALGAHIVFHEGADDRVFERLNQG